ncbi:MAG: HAMP domain-containing protein [Gallionellaceae bacterium]|jgi:protein-histidine pros-kinase|nr:HAMP domain-containing protein [Gallionellaceae bacterium]
MKRWIPDTEFVRLFALLFVMLAAANFLTREVIVDVLGLAPPSPPAELQNKLDEEFEVWVVFQLVAIALVSWIAARWISLPIKRLAQAASEFGDDFNSPPLDETSGSQEVRKASAKFNQMQTRIRQQVAERSYFLAAVSHDLRTPITRLMLRAEKLEPAARTVFQNDLNDMATLINATLDYLRDDWRAEALSLLDVEALMQSLAEDAAELGETVTLTGAAKPIRVKVTALRRCLHNLIGNAVRYGNRADIRLDDGADHLSIIIQDAGPGIPESQLEAIFEPFHRLDESRNRHAGGVGLGLTITRDLVGKLGGTVVLKNAPEGGLIATLTLPRRAAF